MADLKIPLTLTDAGMLGQFELEGFDRRYRLQYNPEGAFYELDVFMPDGTLLAAGQKMASNARALYLHRSIPEVADLLPPGEFWVIDSKGGATDPAYGELGTTVQLFYREAGING